MGQRHVPASDAPTITIDQAVRRLEVDDVGAVARAAFDHAGELATLQHGRSAAVLGAVRLATRRSRTHTLERERFEAFDVDPDDVVAAEELLARHLGSPAPDAEIRTLRRQLIVAHELLAAAERDGVVGPELPGSYLADAVPFLLARATDPDGCRDDVEQRGLGESALREHIARLEDDLEFARLGTRLDALVDVREASASRANRNATRSDDDD